MITKRLALFLIAGFFISYTVVNAEEIYYKNGRMISADILFRKNDTIWVRHVSGTFGINAADIEKITGSNGQISRFSYEYIKQTLLEHIKQKEYPQAVSMCDLLLSLNSADTQLYYLRGFLSQKAGNALKSRQDFIYLVKKECADAKVYNNLGVAYVAEQKLQEAKEMFILAAQADAAMPEAHINLGSLFSQEKDYPAAITQYSLLAQLKPDDRNTLYNQGILYMHTGELIKAGEAWKKLLTLDPENTSAKDALSSLEQGQNAPLRQ